MTDQTVPAADLRAVLDGDGSAADMLEIIREMMPPPPLPTLADMADDDRADCKWMQADVERYPEPGLILEVTDTTTRVAWESGVLGTYLNRQVTPRPDLPRMEWPAAETTPTPAPALPDGFRLADHPDQGRVIVAPKVDKDGDVLIQWSNQWGFYGRKSDFCKPDNLTFLDGPATPAPVEVAPGVTLNQTITNPEVIEYVQDHAPEGTVVTDHRDLAATIRGADEWCRPGGASTALNGVLNYRELRGIVVVRWGSADQ